MRKIILATIIFVSNVAFASGVVDFEFFDVKNNTYQSSSLSSDLKKRHGREFKGVRLFLIKTPSLSNEEYIKQNKALNSLGHEEFSVIFVIASIKEEYKHGYHTSINVAKILNGIVPQFGVLLLNSEGMTLKESNGILSVEQLRLWFRK